MKIRPTTKKRIVITLREREYNKIKDMYFDSTYSPPRVWCILKNFFYSVYSPLRNEELWEFIEKYEEGLEIRNIVSRFKKCESPAERAFFIIAIEFIPNIIPQCSIGKYRVDFLDGDQIFEIDGFEWHGKSKAQFDYDRERSNYIITRGFKQPLRYSANQVYSNNFREKLKNDLERLNNSHDTP